MAFIPAENTALVEFVCLFQDQICENTLYFRRDGGWDLGSMTALWENCLNWWINFVEDYVSVNVELQEIKITDLTSDTAPVYSAAPSPKPNGNVTGDPLPNNVSLAVSFRTSGRGRSSRGRNYVFGLAEAEVTGNVVEAGYLSTIQTAYDSVQSDIAVDLGADWVVVSRYHNKAPRTTALVQQVTAAVIVDPFVDSQRRRLPGRGR